MDATELDQLPGTEWLLDNDYVIQRAVTLVAANTPRDGYRRLPVFSSAARPDQLRALILADELINICGSPLDLRWVRHFLQVYQETVELTLGELWALPNLLRLLVLQRLLDSARSALAGGWSPPDRPDDLPGPASDHGAVIASLIVTLRALDAQDWRAFVESVSVVHRTLSQDPAAAYAQMDQETRDRYRRQVERVARRTGRGECEVARHAIALADDHPPDHREAHVGYYLIDRGVLTLVAALNRKRLWIYEFTAWLERRMDLWYLGAICLLTGVLLWPVALVLLPEAHLAVILAMTPVSVILALTVAVHIVNWFVGLVRSPDVLPKLDFRSGIPTDCRTVVVTPVLLADAAQMDALLDRLQTNYLANPDPTLRYALLTDPVDADVAERPEDDVRLARITAGIEALNDRYGTATYRPFALYHRPRFWNPEEGCYMAWERKRGKLAEFNRFLLGDADQRERLLVGSAEDLTQARFVITLDADTQLAPGAAQALVGTLAHPLNRPLMTDGRLSAGYTMIQPRLAVDPEVAARNLFTRAFAGDVVLDPYTHAVSDVYQDLFGAGIFAGKGIYDVLAFERCLEGRVPENAILSHDLFEGLHGRVGLATDIVLFEDYPDTPLAYGKRAHRWIRGDWQLVPWLLPRVPCSDGGHVPNRFTTLDRWKLLDNLRRSLVAPATLLGLVLAWTVLPGHRWAWTLAVLVSTVVPVTLGSVHAVGSGLARAGTLRALVEHVSWAMHQEVTRWLLLLVFLPYEAYVAVDAAGRSLWRVCVSHRHLLQWVSAAQTGRALRADGRAAGYWRGMVAAPAVALLTGAVLLLLAPAALLEAAPLLLAWLIAPSVAHQMCRARWSARTIPPLDEDDRRLLRLTALRTWSFFERFAGPATHWLPPDNHHEAPRAFTSHRTSPTNIGLMLLASLSAWDLGYLGSATLLTRLRHSFESMERLEHYRGHLYNWYALQTLSALEPRYVSTVDSGNLVGCLIALEQGLEEILETPVSTTKLRHGLIDLLEETSSTTRRVLGDETGTVEVLIAKLKQDVKRCANDERWSELLRRLASEDFPALQSGVLTAVQAAAAGAVAAEDISTLRHALNHLRSHLRISAHEMDLVPWLQVESADTPIGIEAVDAQLNRLATDRPSLRDLPQRCNDLCAAIAGALRNRELSQPVRDRLQILKDRAERAADDARTLIRTAETIIDKSRRWQQEMDFGFLYDPERQLLHIGYNVTAGELDPNYYDLLASEARLASYVAIAKQDIPETHWLHLGRPFVRIGNRRGLASWSATAFEYFMPHLLMAAPRESLLAESCYVAAEEQQAFAQRMHVPWGVSESGFYQLDKQAHYQYRAFGIPGLGLRPEASYRLVISPYASVLALPFTPHEVVSNLRTLEALNMLGRHGFYEAIDFGTAAPGEQRRGQIVRSYMSHHQGMILAALNNAINGAVLVHRFQAEPSIAGHRHLLHEQVPRGSADTIGWRGGEQKRPSAERPYRLQTWRVPGRRSGRQLDVLANGHYQILLSEGGMSTSTWNGLCLSRWQREPCAPQGTCVFVKDLDAGTLWSAGAQPIAASDPADVDVRFAPHMAEFHRRDHGIHLTTTIAVAGDDDVEIQRLVVTNNTDRSRRLLFLSYREPVLAPLADDERHPAFSKMFIEIVETPQEGVLIARRRPREPHETPVYVGLATAEFGGCQRNRQLYADRRAFLGRNGSLAQPELLCGERPAAQAQDAHSLDPVMAGGIEIELPPRGSTDLVFLFTAGHTRAEVLELANRYRSLPRIEWAFQRARQRSERVLSELAIAPNEVRQVMALLSGVLRADPRLRARHLAADSRTAVRPVLWSRGISGDLPLLLLYLRSVEDVRLAEQLVRAQAYWDRHQVAVDLILLDSEIGGYAQPTSTRLSRIVEEFRDRRRHYTQGSVYVVPAAELSSDDRECLLASAWLVLDGDRGDLSEQLALLDSEPVHLPPFVPVPSSPLLPEPTPALERPAMLHDNGFGGFSADGREYIIHLEEGARTPAPWYNVIANPGFGFIVGESGAMCSWAENSGERRLTPWHNDPVLDPSGESLYLRDEETGVVWSPTPQPAPDGAPYQTRHGAGYTTFRHISEGLDQEIRVFADPTDPVKIIRVTLRNCWQRPRRITVTFCAEWVLGLNRERTRPYLVSSYDTGRNALLVRNTFTRDCGRTAFLAASEPLHGFTTDRVEFFGTESDRSAPAALQRIGLMDTVAPVADPCAVLQVHVDLESSSTSTLHFLLGEGDDNAHATALIDSYRSGEACEASWTRVQAFWDEHLDALTVETPDSGLDVMVNRWLLYQVLACRLWGRTALYQSGGGFGFRDQLQDVMALCATRPELARAHILRAAAAQFEAGDVLHWWHERPLRGVRTRCSDDKLWLPYVTAYYVRTTGDDDILAEPVPFLVARELAEEEAERYAEYTACSGPESLLEHCLRAAGSASGRGAHGLPLIGAGDWNDGLNRVGTAGRGESVWLGWFQTVVYRECAYLCERAGRSQQAVELRETAERLLASVEAAAWDGQWYVRAYDDNGQPLGSAANDECAIELIAQVWAVMAGARDEARVRQAMASVERYLAGEGILRLLTPPFEHSRSDPGYIAGYPPGVRENGAQYSHGATWAGWAWAQLGEAERTKAVFDCLNPVRHSETREAALAYRVEPYVVAADIYGVPPYVGRGGWTWYTGAASLTYRLAVEVILGIRRLGRKLEIRPCLPDRWPGYTATLAVEGARYRIVVERGTGPAGLYFNGERQQGSAVPLAESGDHEIRLVL